MIAVGGERRSTNQPRCWKVTVRCTDWTLAAAIANAHATGRGIRLRAPAPAPAGTVLRLILALPEGGWLHLGGTVTRLGPCGASVRLDDAHDVELADLGRRATEAAAAIPEPIDEWRSGATSYSIVRKRPR